MASFLNSDVKVRTTVAVSLGKVVQQEARVDDYKGFETANTNSEWWWDSGSYCAKYDVVIEEQILLLSGVTGL